MRTESTAVVCTSVAPGLNSKVHQAELRQTVTTFYPSVGVNADHDELIPLGSADELEFTSERVCWLNVPVGTTVEDVTALLTEKCCIQRYLSHQPMLSEGDIANGITPEEKAKSQLVRDENGMPALIDGMPQYKRLYFRKSMSQDVDLRTETRDSAFIPDWLAAEMEVMETAPASALQSALESDIPA